MSEAESVEQDISEIEQIAAQRAKDKASAARWNLDIAVFLFAILIIIIILLFQGIGIGVVAPIAIFGLAMVWLSGWRQGRQLYERFFDEELARIRYERIHAAEETTEETVEEKVQRALRERFDKG